MGDRRISLLGWSGASYILAWLYDTIPLKSVSDAQRVRLLSLGSRGFAAQTI